MSLSVLVPQRLPDWLVAELRTRFAVHYCPDAESLSRTLREHAPGIRAIASDGVVSEDLIDALPQLEIIALNAVGTDGVALTAARRRKIIVTNTPGVLTDAVADLALGLTLAVTRRIVEADRFVRQGHWTGEDFALGWSLRGRRMGILGMGRIGRAVANRAVPFGLSILYTDVAPDATLPFEFLPTAVELADRVDILVVTAAGGADTRKLVDERVLAALGPHGFLVNVARGSIVDEAALLRALTSRSIRGAALDVYADEPFVPPALRAMDNVVLQPHHGSGTEETRHAMGRLMVENLERHRHNQPVLTPV